MEQEMAYMGRCRKCHGLNLLTADSLAHKRDVARDVGQSIRDGNYIERISIEAVRANMPPFCKCGERQ